MVNENRSVTPAEIQVFTPLSRSMAGKCQM